jgi:hypothetical protein
MHWATVAEFIQDVLQDRHARIGMTGAVQEDELPTFAKRALIDV